MKKYFFISLLLYGQFVFGQITSSQFIGTYPGTLKVSYGGISYYNDTAIVYTTSVDTVIRVWLNGTNDYSLNQDSTFVDYSQPSVFYGRFYSSDSIYIYHRLGVPFDQYLEFWGKKQNTNIEGLNMEINDITIYPNPANSTITIELNNNCLNNNSHTAIKNILGKSVMTFQINGSHQQMDVSSLSCGIYFIEVNTKYGILSKKLIINR